MEPKVKYLNKVVVSDPDVDSNSWSIGGNYGGGTNTAHMYAVLKPIGVRKSTAEEVIGRIRRQTASLPGAQLFFTPSQDIRVGGRTSNAAYQFTLQSQDLDALKYWAPIVYDHLKKIPIIVDVNSDQQTAGLQSSVVVDRDTASRLGLSASEIDAALYDAFGQAPVSTMYTPLNQYHVVMEVAPKYWQSPQTLKDVYVHSSNGQAVPLSAFCHFLPGNTPLAIAHHGVFPSVTISFSLPAGVALGQAVDAIQQAEVEMGLPVTVLGRFAGTAQAFQDSLSSEPILVATALIAVYIVLGMLYESLIHPITILSTIPSAGLGALLALLLRRTELSVIALIGIILLIGIVKKNAIMMIDFALAAERNEGKSPEDAIYEACVLRFRPIMMTTLAALFGGLPLALGHGNGAELRQPLGIAIVGGLTVSQMLTLFTTPVIYLYLDKMRWTFSSKSKTPAWTTATACGIERRLMEAISAPFIRRPVGTALLTAAVALSGVVTFRLLPVSPLPQVDFPTIQVSAQLPGGSPETMASSVATPLEKQFTRIAGVTEMTSSSTIGSANITLQFDLNRDIDGAARDVQAAINAARSFLPSNLPSNPTWRKSNPSESPSPDSGSHLQDRNQASDVRRGFVDHRPENRPGLWSRTGPGVWECAACRARGTESGRRQQIQHRHRPDRGRPRRRQRQPP